MRPIPLSLLRPALPLLLAALALLAPPAARAADASADRSGDDPVFVPGPPDSGLRLPALLRDAAVPLPGAFLGHRLGERYTAPEAIAAYVRAVALASPRVKVETYGTTAEGRELLLATVTSPANHERLSSVRAALVRLASAEASAEEARTLAAATPAVVWIACGVHGDETSGPEAGLALLYWLAASREDLAAKILEETVVVLDPCVNPDGRARHVGWWRSVAGSVPDEDPWSLEQEPPWPGGRTDHDGFDLNRDWAFSARLQTRARIAAFRATPPQVYVDLHEMGSESSYFFPPPAEPLHAHLPPQTRKWLGVFGRANARAFDARGWSFFVREFFDLFYPGYGDSWPSFQGAIGMTYEAAGATGLAYRRKDGTVLTLKERAVKHLVALRATLETALAHRRELVEDFAAAFRDTAREGKKLFVVPADQDPTRLRRLVEVLTLQGIRVERTKAPLQGLRPGAAVPPGSVVVDSAQPLGRLAQALLEPSAVLPAEFVREERERLLREEHDRFYDVTAWALPTAFGLEAIVTTDRARLAAGREPWVAPSTPPFPREDSGYGWLFSGGDSASRGAAARLLRAGVRVWVTAEPASVSGRAFPAGTFLVRREGNGPGVEAAVAKAASEASARAFGTASAWTEAGPSLGSNTVRPLAAPRVVLLTGDGTDPSSVGALALALRNSLGVPPILRRASSLAEADLRGVTALVVPHGGRRLARDLHREESAGTLRRFVEGGGVLVGIRGGAEALRQKPLSLSEVKAWEAPKAEPDEPGRPSAPKPGPTAPLAGAAKPVASARAGADAEATPAADAATEEDAELVKDLDRRPLGLPGAALRAKAFPEHVLLWGLGRTPDFLVTDGKPPRRLPEANANVVSVVSAQPLASGFAWKEALDRWTGAPLVQMESVGDGKVVSFAADPVFRGTWLGTEGILLNAVLLLPQP